MKKVYVTWSDIQGSVIELARQLQKDNWRPDYIVGITRGGAIPAVMLSQYLGAPMRPLQVSLRDNQDCVSDLGMAEDAFGYVPDNERGDSGTQTDPAYRKNILVVDDINDSGATIAWIKKDWLSGCLPNHSAWNTVWNNNVRFAVIHNNLASKEEVDYSADEINKAEEDCWIVYPWEEFWRG
jgi:hypoxanthine phosphoribosyltransferase